MKNLFLLGLAGFIFLSTSNILAQFGEPDVRKKDVPKNLYDEGYKSGFGFLFGANDFGFGVGGQYRKVLSRYSEAHLTFKINGLKDAREQTYIDYFFGTKTVPDKYKRVISFPISVGLKRRFLAKQISDNFRVYGSFSSGPVFAFSYPYFNDQNNNGFRENTTQLYTSFERPNDVFTGWKEGEWHLGLTGALELGIDFSGNFANLQSFQFGYNFYYFDSGLQILEPTKPLFYQNGEPRYEGGELQTTTSYEPKKYYGSAQLTFIFGWMWD
tara:strand:- start:19429 stop:20238 length:810 start_codon:yes stop_codon:yes gene_type:complete